MVLTHAKDVKSTHAFNMLLNQLFLLVLNVKVHFKFKFKSNSEMRPHIIDSLKTMANMI